ncbi:cation transporter [Euzebya tangerina]|uniref:cation transporter n=1 Tax=Euzebya tangerina TaxID=591198 RepID=UPI000E320527|nr:cation transporter [Euzebya tangerina]
MAVTPTTTPPVLREPDGLERGRAVQRSRALVVLTLVWNSIELVVAMIAGLAASSAALVGFAVDSGVESAASIVLLWRLAAESKPGCSQVDDRRASRAIAVSLLALSILVALEASRQLLTGDAPQVSVVGIVLTGLSVVVMPWLALSKRRLAPVLGSRAVEAESSQTMICAYLSGALLIGLSAHALAGWWWADPVAALGVAALAAWEARNAWHAESLADTCC